MSATIHDDFVTITPFTAIGADKRGLTSSFSLPRKQDHFIYITRKAGTSAGNTYHEGKNNQTNPKLFIILQGKISFSYRHRDSTIVYKQTVDAGYVIAVRPFVVHSMEILEDLILIEANSIEAIEHDRIRENVLLD